MTNIATPGLIPEWAPQCATMLVWPHQDTDWGNNPGSKSNNKSNELQPNKAQPSSLLEDINNTYVDLTHTICRYQPALIICKDTHHEKNIHHQLNNSTPAKMGPKHPVIFVIAPYNDTWCRDSGPLSVYRDDTAVPEVELLDFRFNGWGNKYESGLDDLLCHHLSQAGLLNDPMIPIDFGLEGGSIDGNGDGLLLTTKSCLLSNTRNKGLNQSDIEMQLTNYLGCKKILWLSEGKLFGDDTDSHIDNLARFVNPTTIVYANCVTQSDVHYMPLLAMEKELHNLNNENNLGLNLVPIPIPEPIIDCDTGSRLPGSYINFILINNAVIVPSFGVPEDSLALEIYASLFPTRDIQSISSNHLIRQFGGPHCASMQLPRGVLNITNTTSTKEPA